MKVYYNGSCNICNAEINQYKKIEKKIDYIDDSKFTDSNIEQLSKKNLLVVENKIQNSLWFDCLPEEKNIRSCTSICLKIRESVLEK